MCTRKKHTSPFSDINAQARNTKALSTSGRAESANQNSVQDAKPTYLRMGV